MKLRTLIGFILLAIIGIGELTAQAEGYYPNTSRDVNLASLRPNATRVDGNLLINASNEQHISRLRYVEEIEGDLKIIGTSRLDGLHGFRALNKILGRLEIQDNASLRTLNGINGVTHIRSQVVIKDNPQLNDCRSLSRIRSALTGYSGCHVSGNGANCR